MALLFMDGCDGAGSGAVVQRDPAWFSTSSSHLTKGRFGGGALKGTQTLLPPTNSGNVYVVRWAQTNDGGDIDGGSGGINMLAITDTGEASSHALLKINGTLGAFDLIDANGSVVASAPIGTIKLAQYQTWEMRLTMHDTTGACILLVDEAEVFNVTNEDFSAGGSTVVDAVSFADIDQGSSTETYRDDFIVCDGSAGLGSSHPIGDKRIYSLLPNADGDQTAWTRNGEAGSDYANIDDPLSASPDDDTTYLSADVNKSFTVNVENLPTGTLGIVGVQGKHTVRKDDAGGLTAIQMRMRHSTNEIDSANITLTTDWQRLHHLSEDVPGGSGWTEAQVNALQIGMNIDA